LTGWTNKALLIFFLVIFVLGWFFRLAKKKTSDRFVAAAWRRLATVGLTMGAIGLLFWFFSFEEVRLFGARFWYLVWLLGVVVWLVKIWIGFYRLAPRARAAEAARRQREKYLPRKK
jgi:phosphatidylglycerophosphate synthase